MLILLLLFPSLLFLRLLWLRFRPQPIHDPLTTAAASSSASTSTPNGSSSRGHQYKVFLSFRGEDTRLNFVSHLYKELTKKCIHTFKDDRELKTGDYLTPSLLEAIHGSRVAVVVFSEHYASSTWCLRELVEIMDCRESKGLLVVPIFYKVDPSDVRNQRGSFGEDFEMLRKKRKKEQDYEAEMEKWRNALSQVATIAGCDSRGRDEATFIEDIVKDIFGKLVCATSSDANNLVGIVSHIANIDKLLEVERDVHMLGIWGMGGVGKTTLATVLYDKMSSQYQACCFLGNVKDKFKNHGATSLRKELLSKVLLERDLDRWPLDKDSSMIKDRLCNKKVLIVLDDVDDIEQLKILVKHDNWFGLGSTIIITTRDKRVLNWHKVATYEVKCLKHDQALHLFSQHAFKQNQIKEDYWGLVDDFVDYTKGLPLALKVLGDSLYDRPIKFWEDEQKKLRSIPNRSISEVLKVSFDSLEENEKDAFLDIACFHNWSYKDEARCLLNSCGLFPNSALDLLIERSLISIQEHKVYMHELLQDMGRDIVRHESIKLGERSRLWDSEDINYVLTKKKGTELIKGISLNLSEIQGKMNLEEDAFAGMDRLRFLNIYVPSINSPQKLLFQDKLQLLRCGLQLYSNKLSYLYWDGYPQKSLSLGCCAQSLIKLNLSDSKLETLWEGALEFVNLKVLYLEGSKYLVGTPDLSKAKNIEEINLHNCESLIEVHPSIEFLGKLEMWDMKGCKNLSQLPNGLGNLKSLKELYLSKTAITELPQSIEKLTLLSALELAYCEKLESLPTNLYKLSSLAYIDVHYCKLLRSIPKLPPFLKLLDAAHCASLENFSDNSIKNGIQLEYYEWMGFYFEECLKLSEETRNNIFSFALSTFQKYSPKYVQFWLSGSEIPTWICNQAVGSSINVQKPSNFATIRSVIGCAVFQCEHRPPAGSFLGVQYWWQLKGDPRNQPHIGAKTPRSFYYYNIGSSDQMILYNSTESEAEAEVKAFDYIVGDELSFEFFVEPQTDEWKIKVNKCGICFLVD